MRTALFAIAIYTALTAPANALCSYHGVDDAKTSVSEEMQDSQLVVRARVENADYHWSGKEPSWTLYRLRVLEVFKGQSPHGLKLFTYRDSGGFYLDSESATPDLEHDYLLFLVPVEHGPAAPNAFQINYSCGQSKRWSEVSPAERTTLNRYANDRGLAPKTPAAGGPANPR